MQKDTRLNRYILVNLDDFTDSKTPVTLYAASSEGIYRVVNSEEIWKKVKEAARSLSSIDKVVRAVMYSVSIGGLLVLIMLFEGPSFGVEIRVPSVFLAIYLVLLFALLITMGSLNGAKLSKASEVLRSNSLIGELVVPWGEIYSVTFKNLTVIDDDEYWDVEIHTRSGGVVLIPRVKYAESLLVRIKKKFCPHCDFQMAHQRRGPSKV